MSEFKFDTIYSIGCFDQFHFGHRKLLKKMKSMGKELIIGIHDDSSIEKLKNLSPEHHDKIYTRMQNVSQFADRVFIVPDTDPTECLKCIIKTTDNHSNSCYVRANDMIDFPGKNLVFESAS